MNWGRCRSSTKTTRSAPMSWWRSASAITTCWRRWWGKRSAGGGWIGSARPVGAIIVDEGAVKALVERNRSLLPAGIVKVQGPFARGDLVAIVSPEGKTVARGLTNYPADVVEQVRGKK